MAEVLIAEDDLDHQRVIAEVVRRLGHDVTVADDGWAALVAATHHRPDLLIADVDMPKMDGLQLCRAVRADPLLAGVPIVLVTALLAPGDPQIRQSGAVAVVRKPFDIRELSAVLTEQLDTSATRPGPAVSAVAMPALDPIVIEALLASVEIGLAVCGTDGRLTVCNQFLRDFYGDDSSDLPIKEWAHRFALCHHDGRPLRADELPMVRALAGETVQHAGLTAVDRCGRRRWLTINARPVHDPDGSVVAAVAAVREVTAEYRSRIYQTCKNEILEALAGSRNAAAADDKVVRILATSLGWPYVRLWALDPVSDRLRPTAKYVAENQPEVPLPTSFGREDGLVGACWKRGEMIWLPDIRAADSPVLPAVAAEIAYRSAGAVPVRSRDRITGVLTYFSPEQEDPDPSLVLLVTGIADSIGGSWERRRADELAHNLAATTDEYIALVGHDLRTPMTSIAAYVQLLAESPELTGDLRDLVEVVDRNAQRLRYLIEQLLDLAALETGRLPMAIEDVDLAEVVATAAAHAAPAAADRAIAIDTGGLDSVVVRGDPDRLTQVLHSLLDNALKFSPDHSAVAMTLTADDGTATLTVTDAGVGLPTDEQPQLFRRLYRGDNARHRGIPGNGLGLALARVIVERHRGTITLAANHPTGTTVTIRLPRHHPV